jgi:hypothetical protein
MVKFFAVVCVYCKTYVGTTTMRVSYNLYILYYNF